MTDVPDVRWARSEFGNLGYQRYGSGDVDLALVIGATSHVQRSWSVPGLSDFLHALGSLARVLFYDERGMGVSDPVPDDRPPTLEERVDDLVAVLDAADMERATLVGHTDGAAVAVLASVTHPDRVESIVLVEGYARVARAEDYPIGVSPRVLEQFVEWNERLFFDDEAARAFAVLNCPSIADDPELMRSHIGFIRESVGPAQAVKRARLFLETDVRDVLPVVSKPTLIVHQRSDPMVPVAMGRYLADHVPGAKYVELPGREHPPFYENRDPLVREIAQFLARPTEAVGDETGRRLATVVFTDIVESTARAAEVGDQRWRELLERHDEVASQVVRDFRGRVVKTTGDGLLATFDGPSRAVACAREIDRRLSELGLAIRTGVHTGEIEARADDVAGLAVHVASRIMGLAGAGETLVSSTVRDLAVGSGIRFSDRGTHELKGVPGEWRVLAVSD